MNFALQVVIDKTLARFKHMLAFLACNSFQEQAKASTTTKGARDNYTEATKAYSRINI